MYVSALCARVPLLPYIRYLYEIHMDICTSVRMYGSVGYTGKQGRELI